MWNSFFKTKILSKETYSQNKSCYLVECLSSNFAVYIVIMHHCDWRNEQALKDRWQFFWHGTWFFSVFVCLHAGDVVWCFWINLHLTQFFYNRLICLHHRRVRACYHNYMLLIACWADVGELQGMWPSSLKCSTARCVDFLLAGKGCDVSLWVCVEILTWQDDSGYLRCWIWDKVLPFYKVSLA